MSNLEVHHEEFGSHSGHDSENNLIACAKLATLPSHHREESEAASMVA